MEQNCRMMMTRLLFLPLSIAILTPAQTRAEEDIPVALPTSTEYAEEDDIPSIDSYLRKHEQGILNLELWIESRKLALQTSERTYDPFGRLRDVDLVEPEPEPTPEETITPPAPAGPTFAQMLSNVKPGIISPATGEFVWQGRTFKVGQTMSLTSQGTLRSAQIISVSNAEIVFQETETNERIRLRTSAGRLPSGIESGSNTNTQPPPPGITPTGSHTSSPPISID